jgi:hypothetical protein
MQRGRQNMVAARARVSAGDVRGRARLLVLLIPAIALPLMP